MNITDLSGTKLNFLKQIRYLFNILNNKKYSI